MAKNSIGLIELTSIAAGYLACDAMLKAADVDVVLSRSICSGKYMVMGLGDVKFMAAIGAFLGWEAAVFSLVVAAMIGAAYGVVMVALHKQKWSGRLYFGPFLAAAATIWIFAGPELVTWYLRFSQQILNLLLGH